MRSKKWSTWKIKHWRKSSFFSFRKRKKGMAQKN